MKTTPTDDLYRRLEVDPLARPAVIDAAYRALAKALHPDTSGRDTTREMAAINAAYDVLRDPVERARYDRLRPAGAEPERHPVYMSYGKYKGQPIDQVPTSYLLWVIENVEREGDVFDASQELVRRGKKAA
jgi:curved DNA-binding protein CbpA